MADAPAAASPGPVADAPADPTKTTAPPEGEPPKAPPEPKRTFKIKAAGQIRELDEDALIRHAQMGIGGMEKFEEAARLRKEAEGRLERLKTDPWSVLKELGVDPDEAAERRVWERIQAEQMSPDKRAALEAQRRAEEAERKLKAKEEDGKKAELAQLEQAEAVKLDAEITAALKASDLPKTPATVRRMAALMSKNLEMGLDLTAAQITQIVSEEIQGDMAATIQKMTPPQIEKLVGKKWLDDVRRYYLQQIKSGTTPAASPRPPADAPEQKRRGFISMDELAAEAERRARE